MCNIRMRLVVIAGALLLSSGQTWAAGAAACEAYAKEAAAKAQGMREFDCGYDLNEPRWVTDRKDHARWCLANPEKTIAIERAQRRGQMQVCLTCRVYAGMAVEAAAENSKRNCGLTGPRWNEDAAAHFAWCMARRDDESAAGADVAAAYKSIAAKIQNVTHLETFDRTSQIVNCKINVPILPEAPPKP
jgi:hypothetical protein